MRLFKTNFFTLEKKSLFFVENVILYGESDVI